MRSWLIIFNLTASITLPSRDENTVTVTNVSSVSVTEIEKYPVPGPGAVHFFPQRQCQY